MQTSEAVKKWQCHLRRKMFLGSLFLKRRTGGHLNDASDQNNDVIPARIKPFVDIE